MGVRVRVKNFSKTTRPKDMLFFFKKDTLTIEDEKLFKAYKSVCSSVYIFINIYMFPLLESDFVVYNDTSISVCMQSLVF